MCAGAIYWAGIGRLVYGLSEHRLRELTGNHPENPTLNLPCRDVFASGQRATRLLALCLRTRPRRFTPGSETGSLPQPQKCRGYYNAYTAATKPLNFGER